MLNHNSTNQNSQHLKQTSRSKQPSKRSKQPSKRSKRKQPTIRISYFSGGCFWGIQKHFDTFPGIISTTVGYMGGLKNKPIYSNVVSGTSGHTETIKVIYNSNVTSFRDLLTFFFSIHDPTSLNKQGLNTGTQYRSIVFYNNNKEKQEYYKFIKSYPTQNDIVTELLPVNKHTFNIAEQYHQKYLHKKYK